MNLRTITKEGEPWFVAADVCRALDIHTDAKGHVNTTNALVKIAAKHITISRIEGQKGLPLKLVSEAGLYKLIMRSDKAEAAVFQDWVTDVVLPAIRKDGSYVMGEEKVVTGEMSEDDLIAKAFFALQAKAKRLEAERVVHIEKLAEQQPTSGVFLFQT